MIKNYVKRQDSVKAMQFNGVQDVGDLAMLLGIVSPQFVVKSTADGYEIQFNDSAPICLRAGAYVVKCKDDMEVLDAQEFARRYAPESGYAQMIAEPIRRNSVWPRDVRPYEIRREGDQWL